MRMNVYRGVSVLLAAGLIITGAGIGAQEPGGGRKAQHRETTMAPGARTAQPAARSLRLAAPQDPLDVAMAYVRNSAATFGLTEGDVADVEVSSALTSEHNGVTHVYVRQRFNGIEVHGAVMNINVKDGQVFGAGNSFVPNLAAAISGAGSGMTEAAAIAAAARLLGKEVSDVSTEPILARAAYEPLANGEVALAWIVSIEEAGTSHMWEISLDASTGELFEQTDLTITDAWSAEPDWNDVAAANAAGEAAKSDSESADDPVLIPVPQVPGSGKYRVYQWPHGDPNDGDRNLVTDPADAVSSPFGWHDTDGISGAESNQTVGNNVDAYTDELNDNVADATERATAGSGQTFDFPIDFSLDPVNYKPAATTNLFYWNNIIHDVTYRYGFNEASGNFQTNQYGRFTPTPPETNTGANDQVRAEAQDGGGMNNANFGTNTDGVRPRMQMFLWVPVGGYQVQVQTGTAVGNYTAARANFRPFLADSAVTQPTALVELTSPANGCAPLVGFVPGHIAYSDSGSCSAITKANNARNAGAVGIIINTGQNDANLAAVTGVSTGVGIPLLGVSTNTAAILRPALPFTAKMAFLGVPAVLRDGDFDAGVIVHEYTHGISNRLTGGRIVTGCLAGNEQMGEGWSDFLALALTHDELRSVQRNRGIGPYIRFTGVDGPGIRPTRYSTDMTINPTTYGTTTLGTLVVPHGIGYAWTTALWEVYWNLIDKHGFNQNIYDAWDTGGNNMAVQFVMDGMKLQPCRPGFVTGRDAILQADQLLTGGQNQCVMWKGFAKRGLGFGAQQGSVNTNADNVESFELPASCIAGLAVDPASIAVEHILGASTSRSLEILNTAAVDGTDLNWTITETATTCNAPSDVPWLNVAPVSGTTPGAGSSIAAVTLNAGSLGVGTYNAKLCVTGAGTTVEVPVSMKVIYNFKGFFAPFNVHNVERRAAFIHNVQWSLNGFKGMGIFGGGAPQSRQVDCATGDPLGPFSYSDRPGDTSLKYTSRTDTYQWSWNTDKSWANTCRQLVVTLDDATEHSIQVKFIK
jgi:extracellular elastinolytic metalloproteinase